MFTRSSRENASKQLGIGFAGSSLVVVFANKFSTVSVDYWTADFSIITHY